MKFYSKFEKEEIIFRDHLAIDRTHLANERTLLAYVRTSLAVVVSGITGLNLLKETYMTIICWIGIFAGLMILVAGIIRFFRIRKKLKLK